MNEIKLKFSSNLESKLLNINGSSRLNKLLSYYNTWSLPKHPLNDNLYNLLLKLVDIRKKAFSREVFSLVELKYIFTIKVDSSHDRSIVEHFKMHYYILKEIKKEILKHNKSLKQIGLAFHDFGNTSFT